jgi:hypothetical protein
MKKDYTFILIVVLWLLAALVTIPHVGAGTFRDDFEDGDLDGWRQAHPADPMLWRTVDGELECTRQDRVSTILVIGEDDWSDYTIEYDVMLLEDLGTGDVDVMARYIDPVWSHVIIFGIGDFLGEPAVFTERFPDDVTTQKPFGPLELNEWHHIKLQAEGDNFTFWVNDEKIIEHKDEAVKSGSIGLGLANHTARFDNVEIAGPDVPDVTPPTWKAHPIQPRNKLAETWGKIKLSQ